MSWTDPLGLPPGRAASVEERLVRIQEGRWDETLHPRGPLGRWVESFRERAARAMGRETSVLGVTPFLTERRPGRPHPDLVPSGPLRRFRDAAAFRDRHAVLFDDFERDADELAREHGVSIARGERNVGVFEGNFEPSYAVRVRGEKARIDAFARELGSRYDQKAVVGFTADRKGPDMEAHFSGGTDPDGFYRELVRIMGEDAGAAYDRGDWRVFLFAGAGTEAKKTLGALSEAAARMGMGVRFARGRGDYHELRSGTG